MKILILSDSLALPRILPEKCIYEETYPALLKKEHEVHQVSIGSATSAVLLKQVHYHSSFNPDVVILQVGIVDCVPRFMSLKELNATYALGNLGKSIRYLFNKKWIRKVRKISYIDIIEFEQNVREIQFSFNCPVLSIGIIPSSQEYENVLPGVTERINMYNEILEKNYAYFINTSGLNDSGGIMSDHHHLNGKGHSLIFDKIKHLLTHILS